MQEQRRSAFGFSLGLMFGLVCLAAWPLQAQPPMAGGCMGMAGSGATGGCPCCAGQAGQGMAGGGMGQGPGMRGNPANAADMEVFHFLIANRADIRRSVTNRADGVETLTESDVPEVADKLRGHVAAMARRLQEKRPIHQRDPLFAEVFRHADQITVAIEPTPKGLKVVETSADPQVARLIQQHADVVSKFLENGMREMMTDHPIKQR